MLEKKQKGHGWKLGRGGQKYNQKIREKKNMLEKKQKGQGWGKKANELYQKY